MTPVLRKLFAALCIGLLALPAAAELCAAANAMECQASQHECCEGPRLINCDCDDAHAAEQSEPAQRTHSSRTDNVAIALVSERPQVTSPVVALDSSHRAVGASERLSLLSTLLI